MHLTPTVLTTSAHTEKQTHYWHEQQKQHSQYCQDYEAELIVDSLEMRGEERR